MRYLLLTALILCGAAFAHAQEDATTADGPGRIYLTWGAGYGLPHADSSFTRSGGDSSRVDTLYLSFDPGRPCSTFVGMTGTLWFKALDGDTLGPLWRSPDGKSLPDGMAVEFTRANDAGHVFPWTTFGIGHAAYARSTGNASRIRLIWAVMPGSGPRVEPGKLYGLARLLMRRPLAGTPGTDQPVCISWTDATMAYRPGDEPPVSAGVRFVGINARGGELGCETGPDPRTPARPKSGKLKKTSTNR